MWIIVAVVVLIVLAALFFVLKNADNISNSNIQANVEKKVYAVPKQRRYPWFYVKECRFFADGSSRFSYSDEDIEKMVNRQEEAIFKGEFVKAARLANEIAKAAPKIDKIWTNKIIAIFQDVLQKELAWDEQCSKNVINACFGFLQTYENVLERSLATKHTLIPMIIKNTEAIIKYQNQKVSKLHNFEVYNFLVNLYYVLPYKDVLGLVSNNILEDKFDRKFENNDYARRVIDSFTSHIDMLRTRNTSRLQETFDNRKITNCTLINENEANIIMFELNFEPGEKRQKIEALFFDERGEEIFFGIKAKERFTDVFENDSQRGNTIKEEIVILTERHINTVRVRLYKEEAVPNLKQEQQQEKKAEDKPKETTEKNNEPSLNEEKKEVVTTDNTNSTAEPQKEGEEVEIKKEDGNEASFQKQEEIKIQQTLVYPSFDEIKDIKLNDYQLVCLKNDGTVVSIGDGNKAAQTANWVDIDKIFIADHATFGVKNDGTITFAGNSKYEKSEYVYSWENVDRIIFGDRHILALSKNATLMATGSNDNGQCDVDEWYDIIDVCANHHSVGLTKDGHVKATGENNFGECDVASWNDITQIAVGDFYTVGLLASGKVIATGLNSCGQCNVTEWSNIKAIFAAGNMTIGLRYDGRVVTAGKNSYRFDDVKRWNRIKNIVLSGNRIIGIEQDGSLFATGKPYREFVPDEWQNIKTATISNNGIVALKNDGTLISNGLVFGQHLSSEMKNILEIREDLQTNHVATLSDQGTVTLVNKNIESDLGDIYPTIYNVKKIDISSSHLVSLKNDGNVSFVNLKEKTLEDVPEWNSIIDVRAGDGFIVGLHIDGKVVAMGDNQYGQCEVQNWSEIVKIGAAGNRTIGQTIDGKLMICGTNEFGENDFISVLRDVKDFAMTRLQTMVLEKDGTVKVTYHPIGVNAENIKEWKNIKKVVAREDNFLGLTDEGLVLSTLENEVEVPKWRDVDDIDASGSYTWAKLKME